MRLYNLHTRSLFFDCIRMTCHDHRLDVIIREYLPMGAYIFGRDWNGVPITHNILSSDSWIYNETLDAAITHTRDDDSGKRTPSMRLRFFKMTLPTAEEALPEFVR